MSQVNTLDNHAAAIAEYGELHAAKKRIEERMKELGEEIRPALEGRGPTVIDGYMFECKLMPGRKTLDKKAMVEDGIDFTPYEKQGAPYTQLTVKVVNTV